MAEIKEQAPAISLRNKLRTANGLANAAAQTSEIEGTFAVDRKSALEEIDLFLSQFPIQKAIAIRRGMRELSALGPANEHFGIRELLQSNSLRDLDAIFHPVLGSIRISDSDYHSLPQPLKGFYNPSRVYQEEGMTDLRGDSYFLALDSSKDYVAKLKGIQTDFKEGLNLVRDFDRRNIQTESEYLAYLGVLDYLKNHSIDLFHAITYNERYGVFPDEPEAKATYLEAKNNSVELARRMTRMFYQTLVGLEFDHSLDTEGLNTTVNQLVSYEKTLFRKGRAKGKSFSRFRYPEVNHPIIIALGVEEVVYNQPSIDTIVGVPSGGTESAFVAQMMYEQLKHLKTDVIFIPLSLHSNARGRLQATLPEMLRDYYEPQIHDKRILVVDDNSSTGQTLESISRALINNGAAQVNAHIVEFDNRGLSGFKERSTVQSSYFNPSTSPTTVGIARIDSDGYPTYRREIDKRLKSGRG